MSLCVVSSCFPDFLVIWEPKLYLTRVGKVKGESDCECENYVSAVVEATVQCSAKVEWDQCYLTK